MNDESKVTPITDHIKQEAEKMKAKPEPGLEIMPLLKAAEKNLIEAERNIQQMAWGMYQARNLKPEEAFRAAMEFHALQERRNARLIDMENEKIKQENMRRVALRNKDLEEGTLVNEKGEEVKTEEDNPADDENNNMPEVRKEVSDAAEGDDGRE